MDDTRKLQYLNSTLKFPCGVTVTITEEKLSWIFNLFGLQKELHEIISYQFTTIPKMKAHQIKSYLT